MYMCTYKKRFIQRKKERGEVGLLTGQSPQVQYFFPFFMTNQRHLVLEGFPHMQ